jgi:hypothetical protein
VRSTTSYPRDRRAIDVEEELFDFFEKALEGIAIFSMGLDIPPSLGLANIVSPRGHGHLGKP